jgi:putative addiction module killer protein
MLDVVQYVTETGDCPFADWFASLPSGAALKVRTAVARMEAGNLGDAKSVGGGVMERRVDWGPGYRLYFGREGDTVVILLLGGTKKRQGNDITRARACWTAYRSRRKTEH